MDKEGIHPDPDKIKAVSEFPVPASLTEVRSFLGFGSYYRRFVKNFASLAASLHDLLKKDKEFKWTDAQEISFRRLKKELISEPVLGHFDENAPTQIHTDASGYGIGTVLVQIQEARERPIAYASRTLTGPEKN